MLWKLKSWSLKKYSGTPLIEQLHPGSALAVPKEAFSFEHDVGGREIARRREDAKSAILTKRNVLGLPEKITVVGAEGAVVRERSYTWSKEGPLARVSDADGGERKYELDALGRPLRVSGLGANEAYTYTPTGIPLPASGDVAMARGSRPIRAGDTQLGWDNRGRLVARISPDPARSFRYTFDANDRLVEATRGDGRSIKYLYDALGRRLAEQSGGASTWFGWEGDTLVEEAATGGQRTYRVFGPDCLSPILEGNETGMRLVATDAVGTPFLLLDEGGRAASMELTAWGSLAQHEGEITSLRFGGQRADSLTGLSYNRNRYYDPELGVFISPDPLGFRITPNEIGFVPNTTYYIDPLGLLTIVQANDDPAVASSAARLQANNPGSTIVRAVDLTSSSLSSESQVVVVSHGDPGSIQWGSGNASGSQVAAALNGAGFNGKAPGAQVAVVACNSATPGILSQSVAQGVATGTGAQTFGAQSNSWLGTNVFGSTTPDPATPGVNKTPGIMRVGGTGNAMVHDGRWVSVQPRPWYQPWQSSTPQGTPPTSTSRATSGLFGP